MIVLEAWRETLVREAVLSERSFLKYTTWIVMQIKMRRTGTIRLKEIMKPNA
jgi:hypothetical protein